MSTHSSTPPPKISSPSSSAQLNNTSTNSTTTVASTTMPITTPSTTPVSNLTGSNHTSSNNNTTNSLLNASTKNKSNLLANHLNNTNNSTTIIEQPTVNGTQNFCLKWNHHTSNLVRNLTEMIIDQQIVDVTLACDGSQSIKAHKLILSACSNYFKELFIANPCKHPIVILKDIKIHEMKAIVDFMYKGEVNVSQNQLSSLLRTAEMLSVKGLIDVAGCDNLTSSEKITSTDNVATSLLNKLTALDSSVAATLNGKINLSNGQLNYDNLQSDSLNSSTNQLYNNSNLLNLASLSGLRINNLNTNMNNLTNNLLNLREMNSHELLKRKKKRKRSLNNFNLYPSKNQNNTNNTNDADQAISLVTNKDNSENNDNSSNSCNSSNNSLNSTDNSTINNSLRNLCYIKKEQQLLQNDQNESDCGNYSGDESNDALRKTKDLLNALAAANALQQNNSNSVANFYRSSTPDTNNQHILAIRRKIMQQQFSTLSPKTGHDVPDNSDNSNWIQSRHIVETSLIESYEDNDEEMIDVRPIVSFDEGSSNVPTNNFNSDQAIANSLDLSLPNPPTSQSGKVVICELCNLTFTAQSSLRRHMSRHYHNRERFPCEVCGKTYSRKDYLKEHKKLKHLNNSQVHHANSNVVNC